ncbi:TPA: glycosyltransferase, partial [Enterococcus faecium]
MKNKIGIIIVTYNPDNNIKLLVDTLIQEKQNKLIIVDNGSDNINSFQFEMMENLILKKMNENIGLATAQNIGIEIAKKEKCD